MNDKFQNKTQAEFAEISRLISLAIEEARFLLYQMKLTPTNIHDSKKKLTVNH